MKHYLVKTTETFENDMKDIHDYIFYTLVNPQAAKKIYNKFKKAIIGLETFPYRYPAIDLKTSTGFEYHRTVIDNYQMFYYVDDLIVWVTDILSSSSNIIERLKERHSQ